MLNENITKQLEIINNRPAQDVKRRKTVKK